MSKVQYEGREQGVEGQDEVGLPEGRRPIDKRVSEKKTPKF